MQTQAEEFDAVRSARELAKWFRFGAAAAEMLLSL